MKTSIQDLARNVDNELLEQSILLAVNLSRREDLQRKLHSKYLTEEQVKECGDELDRVYSSYHEINAALRALDSVHEVYNWNRAWIVSGGHVHKVQKGCPGFKYNTVAHLLPACSAMTEDEIVDLAGDRACTFCYPSAPVEKLAQPSRLFALDEAAKAERKTERETKAAEKEAKKLTVTFGEVDNGRGGTYIDRETYGSVRSARNAAMDAYWWALYAVTFGGENKRSLVEERLTRFAKINQAILAHRDNEVTHLHKLEGELISKVETKFVREMRGDKTRVEFLDEVREALATALTQN